LEYGAAVEKRAKWVNTICVTGIVLGCLGFCCDLFGVGSMLASEQFAKLVPDQRAAFEASMKHRPLMIAWASVQLVYSLALIVFSALALGAIERHAHMLRLTLRVGIPFVAVGVLLTAYMQWTQPMALPGQNEAVKGAAVVMRGVTMVFLIAWSALKVAFFVWGDRYLARPLERVADEARVEPELPA
jgi:hypothetical protein